MGVVGVKKKYLDGQAFVELDRGKKSHRLQRPFVQRGYSGRRGQRVGHRGRRRAEGKKCERAEIREGKVGVAVALRGSLVGSVSYLRTRL